MCRHPTEHAGEIKQSLFQQPAPLQPHGFKPTGREASAQRLGLHDLILGLYII